MNKSLWLDIPIKKHYPKVESDLEVDILVIGGGITGITSALLLIEEGYKVGIIESNRFFHSTTGNTTAKVTIQHGLVYDKLISKHGINKAQLYKNSNEKAIELIKSMINEYQIECDYETKPAFVYTQKDMYINNIEKEFRAAEKLGIDAFITDDLGLPFQVKTAIGFKNQGQFHVLKYCQKLLEEFEKNDDSYIFEDTKVIDIKEDNNFCHTHLENGKKVKSRHVIVASHFPCHDLLNFYFAKLKPSSTYLISVKNEIKLPNGLYLNVEKPSRTMRNQKFDGEDILIVGGENHQTGHFKKEDYFEIIYKFAKDNFNATKKMHEWMTQDFYTFDKLPYIGRINNKYQNVYIATGYKKWGMTQSHVAAMVLKDIINNKKNDYIDLYDPIRLSDKLSYQFYHYNLSSAKTLITGRLKSAPKKLNLEIGEGKVFSHNGKKYGAYKDDNEQIYVVDVTCPHLKCILQFNQDERTYDCPCHGSRFTFKGKYIDGPSIKDLKRINFKNIE